MVALEATEPREAHQSPPDLADLLLVGDHFRDCSPDGRVACGNGLWSPHDFILCSSLLRVHFVERQTHVVPEGHIQRYDFSAATARCGWKDEVCSALGEHIGQNC